QPRLLLALERRATEEISLLAELDHPRQTRLERRRLAVDLVAIKRHAGLEPQRVATTKPSRLEAEGSAEAQQLLPDRRGGGGWHVELEAVFTGVAGARDDPRGLADPP